VLSGVALIFVSIQVSVDDSVFLVCQINSLLSFTCFFLSSFFFV
jgi:hypothetical protein